MSVTTRYQKLREALDRQCLECGRKPEDVLLLAVSKTVGPDEVAEALEAGASAFGENRPDELMRKKKVFPDVSFHFIGNIQSRRIPDIVANADLIHSVCKVDHLQKINTAALALGKVQLLLLEVNVSGEESKSGFEPDEVLEVIRVSQKFQNLSVQGLMTMAPRNDHDAIVEAFQGLARLRDNLQQTLEKEGIENRLTTLSMGMTEDWPLAVPLGSTIVRVGRAIFDDAFE